jgi:hypothetical protein
LNRMTRVAAALPLALLLWACPKERKDAVIRFEGERLVIDGDRSDCIVRLWLSTPNPDPKAPLPWSLESPMPITDDATCPLRFPIVYGIAPARVSATPRPAAPLKPGHHYQMWADGVNADHVVEFVAR